VCERERETERGGEERGREILFKSYCRCFSTFENITCSKPMGKFTEEIRIVDLNVLNSFLEY
jgi:hypothetical protein